MRWSTGSPLRWIMWKQTFSSFGTKQISIFSSAPLRPTRLHRPNFLSRKPYLFSIRSGNIHKIKSLAKSGSQKRIKKNSFQHAQPSAGAPNLYVYCAGTATGTFEDNFLATTEATIGIACGLSNIVDVANKCGADTTWMTNA